MYTSHRAFTIIEVLVASTIASGVLVGAFLLLSSGFRQADTLERGREIEGIAQSTRNCLLSYTGSTFTPLRWAPESQIHFGVDLLQCTIGVGEILIRTARGPESGMTRSYTSSFVVYTGVTDATSRVDYRVVGPSSTLSGSFELAK